jgi:hypothetical protein
VRNRIAALLGLAGLCVALAGCGGGGSIVQGKVVDNGQPYTLPPDTNLSIMLNPQDKGGIGGSGSVQQDGTFTIKSSTGGGIPNGKYKVGYTLYSKPAGKKNSPPTPVTKETDEIWDVAPGKTYTLDIGKTKGAAGKK